MKPWTFQALSARGIVLIEQRVRLDRMPFDIVANGVQTEHDFDFKVNEGELRLTASDVGVTFDELSEEEEGFLTSQIFTIKIEGKFHLWWLYDANCICINGADYADEKQRHLQFGYSGGITKHKDFKLGA